MNVVDICSVSIQKQWHESKHTLVNVGITSALHTLIISAMTCTLHHVLIPLKEKTLKIFPFSSRGKTA